MRVERQIVDGVLVVSVGEPVEVDVGHADAFKEAVLSAVGTEPVVVLDVSLVEFFDSAGMSALLSIQKRVVERGGKLALCGLNRAVQEIFQMIGFDLVFLTCPDVPKALAAMKR